MESYVAMEGSAGKSPVASSVIALPLPMQDHSAPKVGDLNLYPCQQDTRQALYVFASASVSVCVRACVHACVRMHVCVCVYMSVVKLVETKVAAFKIFF